MLTVLTFDGSEPVPFKTVSAEPLPLINSAMTGEYPGAALHPLNTAAAPHQIEAAPDDKKIAAAINGTAQGLRIHRDRSKIKLRGMVSSSEEQKILLGMIEASFPGFKISDKTKVNDRIQHSETWLSGFSFALRQLALMRSGSAKINESSISLSGIAQNAESYEQVQKALKSQLPQGVSLAGMAIKPPEAAYIWLAQYQAGSITMTGHVPDKSSHVMLATLAERLFPDAELNSSMEVEDGAPENWVDAASLSLQALRLLQSGSVSLADQTIKIDGIPASDEDAAKLADLNDSLPEGFILESDVMSLERTFLDIR